MKGERNVFGWLTIGYGPIDVELREGKGRLKLMKRQKMFRENKFMMYNGPIMRGCKLRGVKTVSREQILDVR